MKYSGVLIAVRDMEKSKEFYREILGLQMIGDFGANVQLQGNVFLQTIETWKDFIRTDEIALKNNASELYFEEDNIDDFVVMLENRMVKYVHPLIEHRWGQRAIRFYDPDGHIIEVAENIKAVVKRFFDGGMTVEEVAVRMDVPVDYVKECLNLENR